MAEQILYENSSGDTWTLARDPASNLPVVKHQPNVNSGRKISYVPIGKFLRDGASGPEHQALLKLIGTLIDASGRSRAISGHLEGSG
jgi:hypothetical protein